MHSRALRKRGPIHLDLPGDSPPLQAGGAATAKSNGMRHVRPRERTSSVSVSVLWRHCFISMEPEFPHFEVYKNVLLNT